MTLHQGFSNVFPEGPGSDLISLTFLRTDLSVSESVGNITPTTSVMQSFMSDP